MAGLNEDMNMNDIKNIMKEFAKQSGKMENNAEMMNEQLDMAMDAEGTEAEADDVYSSILGEVGMSMNN